MSEPSSAKVLEEPLWPTCLMLAGAAEVPLRYDELASKGIPTSEITNASVVKIKRLHVQKSVVADAEVLLHAVVKASASQH